MRQAVSPGSNPAFDPYPTETPPKSITAITIYESMA
jgi:hypothetical protein